jgi:hypothetical protein
MTLTRPTKLRGHRQFRLRHLLIGWVLFEIELFDLRYRIGDGGIGVGPRKTDFQRGKQNPVEDDRHRIGPPYPGVPQAFADLERLDFEAVILALHVELPDMILGVEGSMRWKKQM